MKELTVNEICKKLSLADEDELRVLQRSLVLDTRKGVVDALRRAQARIDARKAETERVAAMFGFDREMACKAGGESAGYVLGLDEVGRGPMAGPLVVGAVVFPLDVTFIEGLNDSKQIAESKRPSIADEIKASVLVYAIEQVPPEVIDEIGMTASLKKAFGNAISKIEETGVRADVVLLDGNPLGVHPLEVNVVKGDTKSAAIAAASVIAKVHRDNLMVEMDSVYPGYGFAENKGYGTAFHRDSLRELGLSPIHRKTFCTEFNQMSLF